MNLDYSATEEATQRAADLRAGAKENLESTKKLREEADSYEQRASDMTRLADEYLDLLATARVARGI